MTPSEIGRLGARARNARLTAKERQALSRKAALALQATTPPAKLREWRQLGVRAMQATLTPAKIQARAEKAAATRMSRYTAAERSAFTSGPRKYPAGTPCGNAPTCAGEARIKGLCQRCYDKHRHYLRKCAGAGVEVE